MRSHESALIGRDHDVAALETVVRKQRLVTLWGAGGSGKTRLAERVAERIEDAFADGVQLVACADLQSSDLFAVQVAIALGLPVPDQRAAPDVLVEWLRVRHCLLVLDNFEHVLEGCVDLVDRLLSTCPRLHILITSRELLSLTGEQAYPVHPLTFPPPDRFPNVPSVASVHTVPLTATAAEVEQVRTYSAVQLFIRCAQRVQPDFALTSQNAFQVATICRLLDGLPLAIELAAARVRMLALAQLTERLAQSTAILSATNRLAPARQQTLDATISWSYDLLTPLEQVVFRRLALLAGSFDLSLVESLAHDSGLVESVDTVLLLAHLIDKSLVSVVSLEGIARYRLLDTIRHFGRERLEQLGETEATYQRYGEWVLQLAQEAEAQLRGPHQGRWFERIEAEFEHIRSVLRWFLEQGRATSVVRVSSALVLFCEHRAHAHEVAQWLEAALAQQETLEPALHAKAFLALGALSIRWAPMDQLGKYLPQAQGYLYKAQERYTQLDDPTGMAGALYQLGYIDFWQADYTAATKCFEAGLAVVPDEALGLRADLWDRLAISRSRLGDHRRAIDLYHKSLTVRRQIEDMSGLALTLSWLGGALSCQGDHAQAEQYLRESLLHFAALGARGEYVCALVTLCDVALALGEPALVQDYLGEAFSSIWPEYDLWLGVELFERLARIALLQRRPLQAARLFGISAMFSQQPSSHVPDSFWEALQTLSPHLKLAVSRESATRAPYVAAWREGLNMRLEEAFAFALRCFEPGVDEPDSQEPQDQEASALETITAPTDGSAPAGAGILTVLEHGIVSLRFEALGGGHVYRGEDRTRVTWHYSKARELLFYLLDAPSRTKDQICLALWPDSETEQASTHMRVTLYHLRKTLGAVDCILHSNAGYAYNRLLPHWYDVERFQTLITQVETVRSAQQTSPGATEAVTAIIELLGEACALYRGEYLADLSPRDWIMERQAQLRRHYIDALRLLGQSYQRQGDIQHALACYQQLTAHDPYDEQAHAAILRCYVRSGQRSRALRYYRDFQDFLRDELGVTPDPHITAYVRALLAESSAAS